MGLGNSPLDFNRTVKQNMFQAGKSWSQVHAQKGVKNKDFAKRV